MNGLPSLAGKVVVVTGATQGIDMRLPAASSHTRTNAADSRMSRLPLWPIQNDLGLYPGRDRTR